MDGSQVAEVLLVRAVEEVKPEAIPPARLIEALEAAGPFEDAPPWYARRAAHLMDRALGGYEAILSMAGVLRPRVIALLVLPFLVGVGTNYLGPSQHIHVLYNPISLLILWNLAVYAAGLLQRLWSPSLWIAAPGRVRPPQPEPTPEEAPRRRGRGRGTRPGLITGWLLHRVLPGALLRLTRASAGPRERAADFSKVASRFWEHWVTTARPVLLTRVRRILHLAALGLALGATAGMFARGLFLDYSVVWRSTFLHDPEWIARLLGTFVGPAALLLGQPPPDADEVRAMLGPDGVSAARWIALYAVSALLFIGVPRALLALRASLRLRRIGLELDLDTRDDAYFAALRDKARGVQIDQVMQRIRSDVDAEASRYAEALAAFVCEQLYDQRVLPHLARFRSEGGKLDALERAMAAECDAFGSELEAHAPRAQQDFERSLVAAVERSVGVRAGIQAGAAEDMASKLDARSGDAALQASDALGLRVADGIGAGISAALVGVAGTLSGGFGKVLGVHILVGLLHTTGPVAFLIGAVGGVAVAGTAWWAGRERAAQGLKSVRIPAPVAKLALSEKRLARLAAEGRERCAASVKELVGAELEPLTPRIAEQIWSRVKPILGEAQRVEADADARGAAPN